MGVRGGTAATRRERNKRCTPPPCRVQYLSGALPPPAASAWPGLGSNSKKGTPHGWRPRWDRRWPEERRPATADTNERQAGPRGRGGTAVRQRGAPGQPRPHVPPPPRAGPRRLAVTEQPNPSRLRFKHSPSPIPTCPAAAPPAPATAAAAAQGATEAPPARADPAPPPPTGPQDALTPRQHPPKQQGGEAVGPERGGEGEKGGRALCPPPPCAWVDSRRGGEGGGAGERERGRPAA